MNIAGKVMKEIQTSINQKTAEVNVQNLPKGIYLIELKNGRRRNIQKLIID